MNGRMNDAIRPAAGVIRRSFPARPAFLAIPALPVILTVLAVLAFLPLASAAGAAGLVRPHPSKLTYPPLKVTMPQQVDLKLSNGLEGFLLEDHEIPVVDVYLLIKTYFPERGKFGLNEMAQWVMRNGGTAAWPGDKLNDELEFLAAGLEVSGDNLSTRISCNCLKRDLPHLLEIFADLVQRPAFPDEKVELKRKTMLEDIRRENDEPRGVSQREFAGLIYGDHPYGWRTTEPSVNAITRDDLVQFHSTWFHPSNAIIGVSGDVTQEEIVAALEKAFQGWAPATVTLPKLPEATPPTSKSVNYAYMDINQAYVSMGHEGLNSNNPDRCAVDIVNYILGGGSFTSWITEKVRSDEGLAYHAGSRYGSDPFAFGLFTASAETKAEASGRAMSIMLDQIKRMREQGPSADEIKKAVDSFVNSQVFDYESKSDVMRRLVGLRFEGRPLDTPQRDIETYSKLTAEDIRKAAQKYLQPDKLTILVVGNERLFDRPLSDLGTVREIKLAN